MPEHTPHREQCESCECPVDFHRHATADQDVLCGCPCHQYCDCETCMWLLRNKPIDVEFPVEDALSTKSKSLMPVGYQRYAIGGKEVTREEYEAFERRIRDHASKLWVGENAPPASAMYAEFKRHSLTAHLVLPAEVFNPYSHPMRRLVVRPTGSLFVQLPILQRVEQLVRQRALQLQVARLFKRDGQRYAPTVDAHYRVIRDPIYYHAAVLCEFEIIYCWDATVS